MGGREGKNLSPVSPSSIRHAKPGCTKKEGREEGKEERRKGALVPPNWKEKRGKGGGERKALVNNLFEPNLHDLPLFPPPKKRGKGGGEGKSKHFPVVGGKKEKGRGEKKTSSY